MTGTPRVDAARGTRPGPRRGLQALLAAQGCSALADNALLVVCIALLQQRGMAPWWAPMLKVGFTASYVVLAPFIGTLADAVPKHRLMAWANATKMLGAGLMLSGLHPLLGYAIAGLGAAAYAPAKYGLVTELVPAERLVAVNGWLEVSVVTAVLVGTAAGGALVSAGWLQWSGGLQASVLLVLLVYAVAALLNLAVPDSGVRYRRGPLHPMAQLRDFRAANRTLWSDVDGRLSLTVTTLFWGAGATLQFAVLRWSTEVLRLPLDQAAYLQASVAIGVVAGAAVAGRFVALRHARRMLDAGVVLGMLLLPVGQVSSVGQATVLMVLTGVFGGLLVVPLNALLQHRGYVLLNAGRSVAVQGFNENASVLAMLAVYAGLLAGGVPIVLLMAGLGAGVAACMGLMMWRCRGQPPGPAG